MKRTMKPLTIITLMLAFTLAAACSGGNKSEPGSGAAVAPTAAPEASAPAAAAATQTPEKQEAPLALLGKFALAPSHGPSGTAITASATGLTPNVKYDVIWTSVKGSWELANKDTEFVGRKYKPVETPIASVSADAQGSFQVKFTAPEDFGFQHDVLVRDAEATRNKAGFDIDMQVSISPTSGPPGTPITVEAKGIGWRQMENSWQLSYDNLYTGWLSSVTTQGRARAVIPATGGPGTHVITVLHGDYTFPYMNMQQSPEPDRPQFHIPFTVTNGAAVLPPAAETQLLAVPKTKGPTGNVAVWADPPAGIVGSRADIQAKGLPPNTEVTLTWSTTVGNRVSGSGWDEAVAPLTTARTDASGTLRWPLDVPDDLGGTHVLAVKQGDTTLAQTDFLIQPSAKPLSVERGPSGTEVLIQLHGVGWTETANIFNLVYDNAYGGYACGFNSNGNVQIFLRVSGTPGWHFIDLYPGIYKGKETRPQNFKVPQLTFKDDHPAEVLPAFRFAFYITGESGQ